MTANGLSFVLRIGSIIILARLLLPEHFGIIGMVTALTIMAEKFKDMGLSHATIQSSEITHEQISTLFWINTGIGTLLMITIIVFSQMIARFYNEPRLIGIAIVLSSCFFLGGLTIQHQALLCRQMRFGALGWIQILSNAISIVLSIALAWKGYEYWALVWKEVTRTVFVTIGTWFMCRWVPGLPKRKAEIRYMLRFGVGITGFDLIHLFSHSLDQILIGKYLGAIPLGLYRQAYQLMILPAEQLRFPVQFVAEPALSTLQNERERYRHYYSKIVSLVAFLSMPIAAYFFIFPENIILLLLGEKWIESAQILRILSLSLFVQPVASTCGFVMITCGKTKRYFWWGVMNAVGMIIAFLIGISWGLPGVATGYTVATYVTLIPSLWFGLSETPISVSAFFKAIYLPIIPTLLMSILLIFFNQKITWLNVSAEVLITFVLAILFYCCFWLLLPGGKQKLYEYVSYPLSMIKSKPIFQKT